MASSKLSVKILGVVKSTIEMCYKTYPDLCLEDMQNACDDIILGQPFLSTHKSVIFTFHGNQETLLKKTLQKINVSR